MHADKVSGLYDDLILSFDLVDNQFGVTISFEVLYPHLLSELKANEKSIVLSYIIRAELY